MRKKKKDDQNTRNMVYGVYAWMKLLKIVKSCRWCLGYCGSIMRKHDSLTTRLILHLCYTGNLSKAVFHVNAHRKMQLHLSYFKVSRELYAAVQDAWLHIWQTATVKWKNAKSFTLKRLKSTYATPLTHRWRMSIDLISPQSSWQLQWCSCLCSAGMKCMYVCWWLGPLDAPLISSQQGGCPLDSAGVWCWKPYCFMHKLRR